MTDTIMCVCAEKHQQSRYGPWRGLRSRAVASGLMTLLAVGQRWRDRN